MESIKRHNQRGLIMIIYREPVGGIGLVVDEKIIKKLLKLELIGDVEDSEDIQYALEELNIQSAKKIVNIDDTIYVLIAGDNLDEIITNSAKFTFDVYSKLDIQYNFKDLKPIADIYAY